MFESHENPLIILLGVSGQRERCEDRLGLRFFNTSFLSCYIAVGYANSNSISLRSR